MTTKFIRCSIIPLVCYQMIAVLGIPDWSDEHDLT